MREHVAVHRLLAGTLLLVVVATCSLRTLLGKSALAKAWEDACQAGALLFVLRFGGRHTPATSTEVLVSTALGAAAGALSALLRSRASTLCVVSVAMLLINHPCPNKARRAAGAADAAAPCLPSLGFWQLLLATFGFVSRSAAGSGAGSCLASALCHTVLLVVAAELAAALSGPVPDGDGDGGIAESNRRPGRWMKEGQAQELGAQAERASLSAAAAVAGPRCSSRHGGCSSSGAASPAPQQPSRFGSVAASPRGPPPPSARALARSASLSGPLWRGGVNGGGGGLGGSGDGGAGGGGRAARKLHCDASAYVTSPIHGVPNRTSAAGVSRAAILPPPPPEAQGGLRSCTSCPAQASVPPDAASPPPVHGLPVFDGSGDATAAASGALRRSADLSYRLDGAASPTASPSQQLQTLRRRSPPTLPASVPLQRQATAPATAAAEAAAKACCSISPDTDHANTSAAAAAAVELRLAAALPDLLPGTSHLATDDALPLQSGSGLPCCCDKAAGADTCGNAGHADGRVDEASGLGGVGFCVRAELDELRCHVDGDGAGAAASAAGAGAAGVGGGADIGATEGVADSARGRFSPQGRTALLRSRHEAQHTVVPGPSGAPLPGPGVAPLPPMQEQRPTAAQQEQEEQQRQGHGVSRPPHRQREPRERRVTNSTQDYILLQSTPPRDRGGASGLRARCRHGGGDGTSDGGHAYGGEDEQEEDEEYDSGLYDNDEGYDSDGCFSLILDGDAGVPGADAAVAAPFTAAANAADGTSGAAADAAAGGHWYAPSPPPPIVGLFLDLYGCDVADMADLEDLMSLEEVEAAAAAAPPPLLPPPPPPPTGLAQAPTHPVGLPRVSRLGQQQNAQQGSLEPESAGQALRAAAAPPPRLNVDMDSWPGPRHSSGGGGGGAGGGMEECGAVPDSCRAWRSPATAPALTPTPTGQHPQPLATPWGAAACGVEWGGVELPLKEAFLAQHTAATADDCGQGPQQTELQRMRLRALQLQTVGATGADAGGDWYGGGAADCGDGGGGLHLSASAASLALLDCFLRDSAMLANGEYGDLYCPDRDCESPPSDELYGAEELEGAVWQAGPTHAAQSSHRLDAPSQRQAEVSHERQQEQQQQEQQQRQQVLRQQQRLYEHHAAQLRDAWAAAAAGAQLQHEAHMPAWAQHFALQQQQAQSNQSHPAVQQHTPRLLSEPQSQRLQHEATSSPAPGLGMERPSRQRPVRVRQPSAGQLLARALYGMDSAPPPLLSQPPPQPPPQPPLHQQQHQALHPPQQHAARLEQPHPPQQPLPGSHSYPNPLSYSQRLSLDSAALGQHASQPLRRDLGSLHGSGLSAPAPHARHSLDSAAIQGALAPGAAAALGGGRPAGSAAAGALSRAYAPPHAPAHAHAEEEEDEETFELGEDGGELYSCAADTRRAHADAPPAAQATHGAVAVADASPSWPPPTARMRAGSLVDPFGSAGGGLLFRSLSCRRSLPATRTSTTAAKDGRVGGGAVLRRASRLGGVACSLSPAASGGWVAAVAAAAAPVAAGLPAAAAADSCGAAPPQGHAATAADSVQPIPLLPQPQSSGLSPEWPCGPTLVVPVGFDAGASLRGEAAALGTVSNGCAQVQAGGSTAVPNGSAQLPVPLPLPFHSAAAAAATALTATAAASPPHAAADAHLTLADKVSCGTSVVTRLTLPSEGWGGPGLLAACGGLHSPRTHASSSLDEWTARA